MESRKIEIYNSLFFQTCSKQFLADKFSVSIKTIENTIKTCDDINYSKKLGKYHFKNLLPNYISYKNYFSIFKENFSNLILKKDMLKVTKQMNSKFSNCMINTSELSALSKKIICSAIAINHNCILKVSYKGNKKDREIKYIQPNQIFLVGSVYYLALTYDKKNKENIGKERTFAFNSLEDIEPEEYQNNIIFKTDISRNAFGSYKNAKEIRLRLTDAAANYFTREGLFENESYTFITQESSQEIEIKMLYNNRLEVVKLIQHWMPQIKLIDSSEETTKIREDIKNNFLSFIEKS
jgi:hypothetical protein